MSMYTATQSQKHHLSVGAVIQHQGSYLMLTETSPTVYGMVTGTLEDGETPVAALEREVKEETGYTVSVHTYIGSTSVPTSDHRGLWTKTILWYRCTLLDDVNHLTLPSACPPNVWWFDPNFVASTELVDYTRWPHGLL